MKLSQTTAPYFNKQDETYKTQIGSWTILLQCYLQMDTHHSPDILTHCGQFK